jgi:hypothetical protein
VKGYVQMSRAIRAERAPDRHVVLSDVVALGSVRYAALFEIFDDGHLTDAKGRRVDFRNSVIVMTSNAGAELIKRDMLVLSLGCGNGAMQVAGLASPEAKRFAGPGLKAICEKSRMIRLPLNRANELVQIEKVRKDLQGEQFLVCHLRRCQNCDRNTYDTDALRSAEHSNPNVQSFLRAIARTRPPRSRPPSAASSPG